MLARAMFALDGFLVRRCWHRAGADCQVTASRPGAAPSRRMQPWPQAPGERLLPTNSAECIWRLERIGNACRWANEFQPVGPAHGGKSLRTCGTGP